MTTYEGQVGQSIRDAVKIMAAMAKRNNDRVVAKFNGTKIVANPGDSPAKVLRFYREESERQYRAYKKTRQYKRDIAREKKDKQRLQNQMNKAMRELSSLNFSDFNAVISWLEKISDPSDHVDVVVPHQKIVTIFRRHGYKPNVNCHHQFNGEDKENVARYIIGQALDGLKGHSLDGEEYHYIRSGVFHRFAEEWRNKFSYA